MSKYVIFPVLKTHLQIVSFLNCHVFACYIRRKGSNNFADDSGG